jgi:hypothetical protein
LLSAAAQTSAPADKVNMAAKNLMSFDMISFRIQPEYVVLEAPNAFTLPFASTIFGSYAGSQVAWRTLEI